MIFIFSLFAFLFCFLLVLFCDLCDLLFFFPFVLLCTSGPPYYKCIIVYRFNQYPTQIKVVTASSTITFIVIPSTSGSTSWSCWRRPGRQPIRAGRDVTQRLAQGSPGTGRAKFQRTSSRRTELQRSLKRNGDRTPVKKRHHSKSAVDVEAGSLRVEWPEEVNPQRPESSRSTRSPAAGVSGSFHSNVS